RKISTSVAILRIVLYICKRKIRSGPATAEQGERFARHRFSFVRTEKTDCNDGSAKRKMLQRRAAPFPGIR
ncbi:MAG: hypothetical protein KBH97_03380, partial [Alistipes sp.]|uniref:hypothetical protein n=1 Tax=Alistipes putredinis TaxID=28117 RepID=UPI001B5F7B93|nr:hypothetical protein [Alistipes sp.]